MIKNLDIYLGLTAWGIGIFTAISAVVPFWRYAFEWTYWVAPGFWALCVILMFVVKNRRPLKLWWVWPSFPLAFMVWVLFAILVFGRHFTSGAH